MKPTILALSLILSMTATPAFAKWTLFDDQPEVGRYFIDLGTMTSSTKPKGWTLVNYYSSPKPNIRSAKFLVEANCPDGQIRVLASQWFANSMGKGSISDSQEKPSTWISVKPGSTNERLLTALCVGGVSE